ncbi:hypothetical protein BROUX41_001126 [Berkeleyomyces rouxiae]|uniref:uncharacterized protein n=1 Tax=Berkeleyomyces rouxiae TaxID=2035830 RepID=UPI003B7EB730
MSSITTAPNPALIPRGDTHATLEFYRPPADGSPPVNHVTNAADTNTSTRNYSTTPERVLIRDLRTDPRTRPAPTLDHDGFQLITPGATTGGPATSGPGSATALATAPESAFAADASIAAQYYPEVRALLLAAVPGATRVHIFDHTVRRALPGAARAPVNVVHVDQTAASVEKRVRHHLPDDAEALLRARYRIVNVWRPLGAAVESFPLAFASSASVRDEDIVPVKHVYENGYTGETAAVKFHPDQKWWYLSGVTTDERILIECFDSEALKEGNEVKGGRTPHSAFEHPDTAPTARPRESIEVRALVFGP